MPEQSMFTIERHGGDVEIRMVTIPDDLDDVVEGGGAGIAFSRRDALDFAWRVVKVALWL